jgi:hypothetical protein
VPIAFSRFFSLTPQAQEKKLQKKKRRYLGRCPNPRPLFEKSGAKTLNLCL